MLRSIVRGDIHPSDLQTEEEPPEDYFETVCKATEDGNLGVFSITAPDGGEYLYFKPLMPSRQAQESIGDLVEGDTDRRENRR